jgi:hypothetical protein
MAIAAMPPGHELPEMPLILGGWKSTRLELKLRLKGVFTDSFKKYMSL